MTCYMRITGEEVQEIVFPLTKHGYSPPKIVGVVSIDEGFLNTALSRVDFPDGLNNICINGIGPFNLFPQSASSDCDTVYAHPRAVTFLEANKIIFSPLG